MSSHGSTTADFQQPFLTVQLCYTYLWCIGFMPVAKLVNLGPSHTRIQDPVSFATGFNGRKIRPINDLCLDLCHLLNLHSTYPFQTVAFLGGS